MEMGKMWRALVCAYSVYRSQKKTLRQETCKRFACKRFLDRHYFFSTVELIDTEDTGHLAHGKNSSREVSRRTTASPSPCYSVRYDNRVL